jgi:hypothetical protein
METSCKSGSASPANSNWKKPSQNMYHKQKSPHIAETSAYGSVPALSVDAIVTIGSMVEGGSDVPVGGGSSVLVGGGSDVLVGGGSSVLVGGGSGVFVSVGGGRWVLVGAGVKVRVGGRVDVGTTPEESLVLVSVGGIRVRVGIKLGVSVGSSVWVSVLVFGGGIVAVGINSEIDSTVNAATVLIFETAESIRS